MITKRKKAEDLSPAKVKLIVCGRLAIDEKGIYADKINYKC